MSTDIRVLVTGSRIWPEPLNHHVGNRLGQIYGMWLCPGERLLVVHGACPQGVDQLASDWVNRVRHPPLGGFNDVIGEEPHPALWDEYGPGAGFQRNIEMAELGAELALVFGVLCNIRGCPKQRKPKGRGTLPHLTHGTGHCLKQIVRFEIPYELMVVTSDRMRYTGEISDLT